MYDVTISLNITQDGKPFAEFPANYHNVSYDDVVRFQAFGVKMMSELLEWGKQKAAEKKAK